MAAEMEIFQTSVIECQLAAGPSDRESDSESDMKSHAGLDSVHNRYQRMNRRCIKVISDGSK